MYKWQRVSWQIFVGYRCDTAKINNLIYFDVNHRIYYIIHSIDFYIFYSMLSFVVWRVVTFEGKSKTAYFTRLEQFDERETFLESGRDPRSHNSHRNKARVKLAAHDMTENRKKSQLQCKHSIEIYKYIQDRSKTTGGVDGASVCV